MKYYIYSCKNIFEIVNGKKSLSKNKSMYIYESAIAMHFYIQILQDITNSRVLSCYRAFQFDGRGGGILK